MKSLVYSKNIENIEQFYSNEIINENLILKEKLNSTQKIIKVYPTSRLKLYKEKDFINDLWEKTNTPYSSEIFFNFSDFIKHIKSIINYKDAKDLLDEDEFYAVMNNIYNEVELEYFSRSGEKPKRKINNLLSNIILGFIKKGVSLDEISNKLDENSMSYNRLKDIHKLYKAFLNKIEDFSTENQQIKSLNDFIIQNDINFTNISIDTYYFEYFKEFKKNEIELLNTLILKNLKIIINFKYLSKISVNNNLLGLNSLLNNTHLIDLNNDDNYNKISKYLFNQNDKNIKIDIEKEKVNVIECKDMKQEVNYILTLVKKLINIDKYNPSDILIITRNVKKYSNNFKIEFEKNRIPLNISDRPSLKDSPIVDLIFDYVKLLNSNYNNKYLFKLLKSPYLYYDKDKLNINKFILVQNKYRNNFGDLESKIKYYDKILENNSRKDEIIQHKEYLKYVFELLDINIIKNKYDKKEFINKIYNFINILKLDKINYIIKEDNTNYNLFLNTREKERIYSALSVFISSIENIFDVNIKINKKNKISLNDIIDEIDFIREKNRFQIRELFDTSVTFTSVEQARGIDRKITIICGLIEGEFPLHYKTDEVLGVDLSSTEEKHNMLEEELFFEALFSNEQLPDKLFLSYYLTNGNIEVIPSYFINELSRILENYNLIKSSKVDEFINKYILRIKDNNQEISLDKDIEKSSLNSYTEELTNTNKGRIQDRVNRHFSATEIDYLHNYPFYFLYNNLFGLKEKDSFDEQPMVNETGSISHEILQILYSKLAEINKKNKAFHFYLKSKNNNYIDIYTLSLLNVDINIVTKLLKETSDKVFKSYPNNEFFNLQKDIIKNKILNVFNNDKSYLSPESEINYTLPSAYEFRFGYKNDYYLLQNENTDIKFKGSIDRVDLDFKDNKLLIGIIDYKSSDKNHKLSSKFESTTDYSYQMFIYLNALRDILINYYVLNIDNKQIELNIENVEFNYAYYYNINKLELNTYFEASKKDDRRTYKKGFEEQLNLVKEEIFKNIEKVYNLELSHKNKINKYSQSTSLLIR